MGKALVLLLVLMPCSTLAADESAVGINACLWTPTGLCRTFSTPSGTAKWSSSMPAYKGDVLALDVSISDASPIEQITANLDGKAHVIRRNAPWQIQVKTGDLSAGRHEVRLDVRFKGTPRKYSVVRYPFHVQEPVTVVKGSLEELDPYGQRTPVHPVNTSQVSRTCAPVPDSAIDKGISVKLACLEKQSSEALDTGRPIVIREPLVFRMDAKPGIDRWAYSILRDGVQVAGAGPVGRIVYLEIAPKRGDAPGFLPGKVTLRAWGVRNDGAFSPAVEVPLVIE